MIYLVTLNQELFDNPSYKIVSPEESLEMLSSWGKMIQIDSETTGRDAHICELLCFQFGHIDGKNQIVVDCTTVDIKLYKDILENTYCLGQNLKFDLQFLYNHGIIPRKIYDTMIVEQLLHLGYPSGLVSYSLAAIAERRLGEYLDKSVRGEIIWRGLDSRVIEYAANDVTLLYKIYLSQITECKEKSCQVAAKLECDVVPAVAYLEWSGIMLDQDKWKAKMTKDKENLDKAKKALDSFVEAKVSSGSAPGSITVEEEFLISTDSYAGHKDYSLPEGARIVPNSQASVSGGDTVQYNYVKIRKPFPFCEINLQGDLFTGFDTSPHCIINWSSSRQVVNFAKFLGFDTSVQDKETGKDKDSVLEKTLKAQKGINDEFLRLYFDYKESSKLCSTYGQGHLDAVNPKTGRIHTVYHQLGASSGRFSCGSNQPNTDLAKFKNIAPSRVKYPNCQQLPSDHLTRSCFVAPKGSLMVSADFSAEELINFVYTYNKLQMA